MSDTDMPAAPVHTGPAERRALHAYLTPEAHEAWQEFADENGVSMSGILEAVGEALAGDIATTPAREELNGEAVIVLDIIAKRGRRVDAQRRRRGPR